MASKELTIDFKIGIHGRPAVLLVQKVKNYDGVEITIAKNGKSISAKSLMGILSLGINQGSVITITAQGPNEENIVNELSDYIINALAKE